MKPLVLGSLCALTLSLGLLTPQIGAANELPKQPPKDFKLKHLNLNVNHHDTRHRSVPIPGTELLLGGALAGIVYWRGRQKRG